MSISDARIRERVALAGVLLLAVVGRAFILFSGPADLRSDEAVVGLMAKHIVTRGETPLFLYGQPYGGGHALVAYLAAPLFVLFGRSAMLLTGISVAVSVVNVALVFLIVRRYLGLSVAALGALLYAWSPPVVYQAFLVNGGTETFFLALIALHFFLRSYLGPGDVPAPRASAARDGFFAGLFGGLAYWSMDYALLYPVVFLFLWIVTPSRRDGRTIGAFVIGGVIGCLPILVYDVTHDFEHLRLILASPGGAQMGFLRHVGGALAGILTGDLAAFFGGDIDDFQPVGPGAWAHAITALVALAAVLYRYRGDIAQRLHLRPLSSAASAPDVALPPSAAQQRQSPPKAAVPHGTAHAPLPVPLLLAVFMLVYLCMYCVAKFSLPGLRTPRYFLPLCPFVSILIAWAIVQLPKRVAPLGMVLWAFLLSHGVAVSEEIGTRDWHYEHSIRVSEPALQELARACEERGVKVAFAPYEIQWRLMFATDERVLVSSAAISPLARYPWYEKEVSRRVAAGEPCAFIFRRDFAFAEWASKRRLGLITAARFRLTCERAGFSPNGTPVGDEFVIYYPINKRFLRILHDVVEETAPRVPQRR